MNRPNVLWIVTDHQAFANRAIDASHFALQHRLRTRGSAFERAYTVLPICTPSRATMLTGLYPHRHGLTENDGRFGGRAELGRDDHMVQDDFARAGYRCGWFGKWHLTHDASACDFGFGGFSLPGYGYPYGTAAYRAYLSTIQPGPLWAEIEVSGESRRPPGTRIDLTIQETWYDFEAGSAILHGPEEVHEAHFLADAAIRWIGARDDSAPFFVRLDAWGPHPPYTIPSGFESPLGEAEVPLSQNLDLDLKMRPPHHAAYRDQWRDDLREDGFDWPRLTRRTIEHGILVERALVKVVDFLEATGQIENTIVVFCSDHGDAVASNGGVMNKGSLLVEETLRIPLLFAGPGIAALQASESLIGNVDIAPTLLDLCGLSARSDMQGLSAAAQLLDSLAPPHRDTLLVEHYGLHIPILQRGLYAQNWKFVSQQDGFAELYDLSKDPHEMNNLAITCPGHPQLPKLRQLLVQEMHALGDQDARLAPMISALHQ